ncbi:MAG: CehA/McbA family metallohydrolase [Lachnospiraceae bacterium]|nr:CehA/McbA family metallohydrolase [Lachnospiraceae bacterium]
MSIGKYRLRRILAWVMAALMCLSAAPVTTVAAEETETTYTWTKVTSAPDTWAGEYLLVYEADSTTAYVFNGEDAVNDYVEAAISENTIIADKSNAVTLEAVDGGYVLKNASGTYLYQSSDKNGIATTANQSTAANYPLTVTVADDGVDLALSSGPHMRFNASSDQMRFRYYKSSTYTSQQAVTLYALTGETASGGETTEPAETVETPSLTYSQTDMTVTFKCATSGVTYYYSYDETGEYTVLDGSSLDVSEHIGETLYAYAELNGSVSGTNSVELTAASTGDEEQGGETEATVLTIAEVKAAADTTVTYTVEGTVTYVSGKSVYIQDETGGICLYFSTAPSDISLGSDVRAAGTYTTYKGLVELTGVTDYTVIGSTSELPSQTVTIAELASDYSGSQALQSTRVYLTDLTVGTVGTSTTLTDSDGTSIVAYGASSVLTEAGAAEGSVISLYAVVSDYNGYQLYVAQAGDITVTSTGESGGEEEETGLVSGTYVIWAPAYDMALTSTPYATYYLAGEEVTLTDEVLSGYSTAAVWTVTVMTGEDGTQTVTLMQDDSYLGVVVSGSYYNLTFGASENTEWTLEDAGDGLYYLQNSGTGRYLEWYASRSDWSLYSSVSSGSEGMFALQFTPVEDAEDGGESSGTITLADGTYVIWNPAYGYALSSTTVSSSSSYYAGVAVTESESGKISGYGDTELWTVTVTTAEDGTQTLTLEQNGSYMGMNASNYLTFGTADTLNHYTWTIEDAGDGLYYLKDTTSGKYVEWYSSYSDWSTYYSIASGSESMFALKFSPVSEEDYTIDTSLVEDIAQWGGGGPYADGTTAVSGDKYTVNDMLDDAATFTAVVGGSAVQAFTTGTSSGSTDISNWYMGGTGLGSGTDDYLQFVVSTAGWGDMELSFRMRASNTGSGEWQLQYSTDGVSFTNFTTGSYSCSYTAYSSDGTSSAVSLSGSITDGVAKTSIKSATYITFSFDVPEGAENAETLYIRLVPSTTVRANGVSSTPSNQGTVRIDSVVLSGSPIVDDNITGYVTVTPDNTEDQAVGTELTLSSATEGAAIYYRFADTSTGEGEWQLYSADNKPVLSSLPATLETYAVSEGRSDSITRILTYAAGTVSSVKFSPNGGGVYTGDGSVEVTLTTATEGATIYYAVSTDTDEDGNYVYETDSEGNVVYTEYVLNGDGSSPISLDSGFGAVGIMAYAELEGYTASAVTTRSFTERSQEEYNIYFGQLHSHTNYSDGAGSITDAYEHATEVHETTDTLDFLAVTDHSNSFDNASSDSVTINDGFSSEEWSEGTAYAEQYTTDEFVAIFGYEMTWSNGLGHINTYNTDGFQSRTQSDYTTYSTALQNYYATLKTATDSISQFNHPGTTFGDFSDFSYYDEEIDELITLIEVGNGEGAIGSSSYFPSYEYYTRALDKGWHVAPTNNQDNHKGLWGDANTARTVVLADSLTEESIYDAMRNYRVYATEDNDLSIYYTLDGNIMGTILSESDVDSTVTLSVKISDPTDSSLGTVSVIVNGGYVLVSQTVAGNEDTVIFTVSSDYSYYYIKVVEADGDIAVTAPVWVGDVEALDVSTFEADDALAVQDQALNMTLSLYNNESSDFTVESITFTVTDLDGNVTDITDDIVKTTETPTVVESMGTADYSFAYTYSGLGSTIYTATITGTLNGVTKVYTEPLTVSYVSADMVTNVVVDGSHYNDYVTGYYGGNMTELVALAADLSINVTVVEDVEDYYGEDSVLDDCALLIISAPAKKSGTANAGDYTASLYEDEFIEAVQAYVQAGGSVIVCGLADYGEASSSAEYHTAAQQNKLLAAIGSTMSLNDDEAYDVDNNGGQAYRLYLETFNMESDWLTGVVDVDSVADGEDYQVYSQYSGCTVNVGSGTWLVKGFDTTYSIDSDRDGVGASDEIESGSGYSYNIVTPEGEAVFLACEDSGYGGTIFVSGGVFCSDFEVDADVDDYDLPYANTTIITNILSNVQVELPVTDIATVRAAYGDGEGSGSIYKVRGYVTAGTENSDNAFFDCIYIQDETGGIDIFPYAESGLALGTYIEVTGYLAAYQGDIELKVMSYTILDAANAAENIVDPTKLTCAQASDYAANGGLLIQAVGTVKEGSVYYNSDGTLAQFTVVDGTGETVVFIDGYILSGTTGKNTLAASIVEGAAVSAVGVLYMHPETLATDSNTFGQEVAVLRVRDCDEILTISVSESNVITVNAGNIAAVTIDGSAVEAEGNYYVSGNVITFTDSYLSSLGEGEHTAAVIVKVNGSSYELPVTLTITAAPSDSDTDDTSTPDTTTPDTDTTTDSSADSQDTDSTDTSVGDFWTFWNDVIAQIEAAGVNGGTVTIPLTAGYNTMPNSVMQALVENSNVTLVFAYEYDGTEYEITIPAGEAVDDDTAWYGPLWLYAQYGAADPVATGSTATGDSSNVVLWVVLAIIAAGAVTALLVVQKRKKKSNQ